MIMWMDRLLHQNYLDAFLNCFFSFSPGNSATVLFFGMVSSLDLVKGWKCDLQLTPD